MVDCNFTIDDVGKCLIRGYDLSESSAVGFTDCENNQVVVYFPAGKVEVQETEKEFIIYVKK